MGKKLNFITIHFIPNGTGKTRAFILPSILFKALLGTLLAIFAMAIFSIATFSRLNLKATAYNYTKAKNVSLTENKFVFDSLLNVIAALDEKSKRIQKILQNTDNSPLIQNNEDVIAGTFFSNNKENNYLSKVDSINKTRNMDTDKNYIPNIWPAMGIISKGFSPAHPGIDIIGKPNQIVVAAAAGMVVEAGFENDLGNMITIKHSPSYQSTYGHLANVFVKKGDYLLKGQSIATVGNTGNSMGPHLHYEITYNMQKQNPLKYLSK